VNSQQSTVNNNSGATGIDINHPIRLILAVTHSIRYRRVQPSKIYRSTRKSRSDAPYKGQSTVN
ncbi:hypothetical protein QUB56_17565, partial [Microcoleus sp. AR_TQ3_B6]|uniref:hypothetical protein n=1 Tax=Microcoleus sp. AR_TQ3_B6 TaxID=3055284 RepID=UPI002FD1B040